MAVRAVIAILNWDQQEREHKYLGASAEEKAEIRESIGIYENPTSEQLANTKDWCTFKDTVEPRWYGLGVPPALAAGLATSYFLPEYSDGTAPFLVGGLVGLVALLPITELVSGFFHDRRHPSGKDCQDEQNRLGLEYIAKIEGRK